MRLATTLLLTIFCGTTLGIGVAEAGGPIASGELLAGSLSGPSFAESWTFSGVAGERILLAAVTTGGGVSTQVKITEPGGGAPVISTTADRVDYQLLASGTYTVTIEDVGLNDPGTYNIGFINLTSGPLTTGLDPDGGSLDSSEIDTGTMSGAGDFDVFFFTANADERVIVAAVATAGVGFNTVVALYPPGGGPAAVSGGGTDRLELKLPSSGTWTMVVEDAGNDTPGNYTATYLNVTSGPYTTPCDLDGTTIASAEIKTGSFSGVADFDVFQFAGLVGDRVLISDLATGGGSHNTQATIYPPGGGPQELGSSADRVEHQLQATGLYTLVIEDVGLNDAGNYNLGFLNLTSGPLTSIPDPDGGPIVSSEILTGGMSGPGDFDAFTFSGLANERVIAAALATGGAGFNTVLALYPPGGGPAVASSGGGDRIEAKLTSSGIWTIVVEDAGTDTPGSYSTTLLNVTSGPYTTPGDTDGTTIASNEIRTGTFNGVVDFDAFQFTGTTGDRVLFADLPTGGGTHNTQVFLYPPGGGPAELGSAADRIDFQLLSTGLYTLVIEDVGLNDTGGYTLGHLNITSGPLTSGPDPDGGPIVSPDVVSGTMSGPGDFDAFTFTGAANERVILAALATAGAGFNTVVSLYPPAGGAVAANSGGGDRIEHKLTASGTWTMVIEDAGDDTPGSYSATLLNITSGPHTTPGDLDGTTIASSEIKVGSFQAALDFDVYQFTGTTGDRVLFADLATGGGLHNAQVFLYPPGGGPAEIGSSADRVDVQLQSTGLYTLVIEDVGLNDTGSYTLGHLNVTAGPLTNGSDTDGGATASNQVNTGSMSGPGDFDAFTFTGNPNDRVVLGAVATAGAGFNTVITLYPPWGGAFVTSSTGDRTEFKLTSAGPWTIVIEDSGVDTPGDYTMSMLNITAGFFTDGLDMDGGGLTPGLPYNGDASPQCDFDGFLFYGLAGDNAGINCVTTSGAMNTQVTLYPPGGGTAVHSTSADISMHVLGATGYYTLVVEDVGLNDTGSYQLTLTGTGASSVPDGPNGAPVALSLLPVTPSPFTAVTRLSYEVPVAGPVRLRIFNAGGALVRVLLDETRPAGRHEVSWDGRDDRGRDVGSGVYYARLEDGRTLSRRALVRVE